jgi:ferredoxin
MAIIITEECINCGACEPECPNNAIYESGAEWMFSDGTSLSGDYKGLSTGKTIDADDAQDPVSGGAFGADGNELYYIVPDKCTECKGFHDEPQCAAVCPVDCCVDDPGNEESEEVLLEKKDSMHL